MRKEKKYYAIKVGNGVKDIIVTSWYECLKYVDGYSSIYKEFNKKSEAKEYLIQMTDKKIELQLLLNDLYKNKSELDEIQKQFDFKIPEYILEGILKKINPTELTELINMAIISETLSKENGNKLKSKLLNI